jgi:peptidoglycan/LPS O-acetylase OafA/YrhL
MVATRGRTFPALATLPAAIGRPGTSAAYIPQIDGLRCLAILLVMLWHASLRASRHVDDLNHAGHSIRSFYAWLPHGEIGVALFFFVSGFVIAQPFLSRPREQWNFRQFYLRRVRRIYPPYVVALCLCFLVLGVIGYRPANANSFDASAIPLAASFAASLLYLHSVIFDAASRLNPPMWSLEVEILFYLASPWLLAAYMRVGPRGLRTIAGLAAVVAIMAASSLVALYQPFDGRFRLGLLAHLHLFIAGIVAADLAMARQAVARPPAIPSGTAAFDVLLLASLTALLGIGLWLTQVDARPDGGWPSFLANAGVLLSVAGLYAGAMHGRLGRAAFGLPWVCLIGTMCYSIYLTHIVVMQAASTAVLARLPLHDPVLIWGVWFLVLPPAAIVVGLVFYVAVERPFMTTRGRRATPACPVDARVSADAMAPLPQDLGRG